MQSDLYTGDCSKVLNCNSKGRCCKLVSSRLAQVSNPTFVFVCSSKGPKLFSHLYSMLES